MSLANRILLSVEFSGSPEKRQSKAETDAQRLMTSDGLRLRFRKFLLQPRENEETAVEARGEQ